MKNNCDVSGTVARCNGLNCLYFEQWKNKLKIKECVYRDDPMCDCLAAIRAAIEAEHIVDANKMMDAIEDDAFARGDMLKAPCFKCGYNGEKYFQPDVHKCAEKHHRFYKFNHSADAGEKGE